MRCYKVKVRHKTLEDVEAWFCLCLDDPQEELVNLTQACQTRGLNFYPIGETLVETSEQDCLHLYKTNGFKGN